MHPNMRPAAGHCHRQYFGRGRNKSDGLSGAKAGSQRRRFFFSQHPAGGTWLRHGIPVFGNAKALAGTVFPPGFFRASGMSAPPVSYEDWRGE
jgi:hypothetical protein